MVHLSAKNMQFKSGGSKLLPEWEGPFKLIKKTSTKWHIKRIGQIHGILKEAARQPEHVYDAWPRLQYATRSLSTMIMYGYCQ